MTTKDARPAQPEFAWPEATRPALASFGFAGAESVRPGSPRPPRRVLALPGTLMRPLGWAAEPLARLARDDPAFALNLLGMDRARLHALALALDFGVDPAAPRLAARLALAKTGEVIDLAVRLRPHGVRRALGRLPRFVLPRGEYRRLVDLFREPAAARILHCASRVTCVMIAGVAALPPPMRREPVIDAIGWHAAASLTAAMDWLGARDPSGAARLGSILTTAELGRQIHAAAAELLNAPGRPAAPPPRIGAARRVDGPAELADVARRFQNCLATYAARIKAGDYLAFEWEDAGAPVVCGLRRLGHVGWLIDAVRGPANCAPPPATRAAVETAFAAVGVGGPLLGPVFEGLRGASAYERLLDEVVELYADEDDAPAGATAGPGADAARTAGAANDGTREELDETFG